MGPLVLSAPAIPTHVCILGQNCLVNLYLAERVRKDPILRCTGFEELLVMPAGTTSPMILLLDLTDMVVPLSKIIQTLEERLPGVKFLAVSKAISVDEISGFLDLGIDGFMEYDAVEAHLVSALKDIARGETWYPPNMDVHVRRALKCLARRHSGERCALTYREFDIVQLARQRLTNKEIAVLLGIGESTVKFHLVNIFCKLNIGTRDELLEPNRRNQEIVRLLSGTPEVQ